MDFITSLPESRGSDAIFVVVDRFCKLARMEPTKGMVTAFDKVVLLFQCLVPAPWVAEDQSDRSDYLGLAVGSHNALRHGAMSQSPPKVAYV
jgi:hypothetical protein